MKHQKSQNPEDQKVHQILFIDDDETVSKLLAASISRQSTSWRSFIINSLDDIDFSSLKLFDLIVLDLLMPGIDGIECLRRFSSEGVECPIILISGLDARMLSSAKGVGLHYGLDIVSTFHKPVDGKALYQTLENIEGRTPFPLKKRVNNIAFTKRNIESAFARDEFTLFFQPQLAFENLELVGLEALIRWQHPTFGLLSPGFFIAAIEECGLAEKTTLWVIQEAVTKLNALEFSTGFSGVMSVNLPPLVLNEHSIADKILSTLSSLPVNPQRLQFEITESSLEDNVVASLDVQTRLAMRGFRLSIDDFGTGYSSLARLSEGHFDELKIDRFFINKALSSQKDQSILKNMIDMGHQMNMTIVGEGIEDEETYAWLKTQGCDIAQGFLFSRPLPLVDLENWIKDRLPEIRARYQSSTYHNLTR